ncbi:MAG: hypothetical protein II984_06315, partial [Clostridia bacterium]|nr:hypothetical protein [Clostridia bacterium]
MNLFTCLLNQAVTLSIFHVSPWLFGVIAVITLALGIVLFTVRPTITYVDTEGDVVIHKEKHPLWKKVKLHGSAKSGKKLIGWSKVLGKSTPIDKTAVRLTRSITLYTIWEDIEVNSAVSIEFNYMDSDEDVVVKKEFFVLNTKLPDEQIDGVEIDGWGFAPDEAPILTKDDVEATFVINLYPIFEESPVSQAGVPTNNQAIVDILFTDSVANKNIYKESHYLKLSLPTENEQYDNFLGWGFAKDGEIILDKSGAESIFTIQLFSRGVLPEEAPKAEEIVKVIEEPVEVVEEVAEEVVEEAAEEVVEEVVEEVAEEVAEEVVEEVVEEAADEKTAEEAVQEVAEIVEEPMQEEVIEEVAEEVAPEVAEEAIEEAPAEAVEEVVAEEAPAEVVPEVVEVSGEANTVVVPTYFDNEGNKIDIKLSRSITANIIQSDDTVKAYYNELKNHILSYKGVKSRISWKFDSYNRGRDQLFKMKLRGKTICLYCNLNPDDFDKSKYHHERIDAKIFEDVPMLVKVKSGLGLRKAKELVDIEMAGFNIEKNPKAKEVDYISQYPYEENAPLIERGLIKLLIPDDAIVVKSTKPVAEVTEEEALVAEQVVEEVAPEAPIEEVAPEVVEEVVEAPIEEVVEEVVEAPIEEVVEEVIEAPAEEVVEAPIEEVAEEVIEAPIEEVVEEVFEEHEVIVE